MRDAEGDRPLDPSAAALDRAVTDLAARFRTALDPPGHAAVTIGAAEVRRLVGGALPETGLPLEDVLGALSGKVEAGLAGTTGGRYLGYVTGGVLPSAAIAHAWAGAVDQNPGLGRSGRPRPRSRSSSSTGSATFSGSPTRAAC